MSGISARIHFATAAQPPSVSTTTLRHIAGQRWLKSCLCRQHRSSLLEVEATHILQTGAVLVLVEVVTLPEAQQVVEVVEQAARVLLGVLLLPQGVEVEGQLGLSPGQHQDHQAGVQTTDVLLQGTARWEGNESLSWSLTPNLSDMCRASDLCECLHVDDVDESEKEGEPVVHSGHVGQQAAF